MGVTPGMILYYNPDLLLQISAEEVAGVLWHECNHILRFSWDRNEGGDDRRRNIADDLAINSSSRLQKDKHGEPVWKIPKWALFPEKFGLPDGLTAEEYFLLLPTNAAATGICGGSCGGKGAFELELDRILGGRTDVEKEHIRQQTAQRIRDHGTVPGGWSDWATARLTPPVVRWETVFANAMRSTITAVKDGDEELSMAHPSRRHLTPGEPLRPGAVGGAPEFAVIVDTSASMDTRTMIEPCLVEAQHAIVASGAEYVWFIQADADVSAQPLRVRSRDLAKVEVKGRGGTDFRPALERLQTLRPKPAIATYFTDGVGTAPSRPPRGIKVIWGLIGFRGNRVEAPASWGRAVHIR